ncbi:hypothetical protein [Agromyces archimandritae]|uniref:Uncharacterized protein n=1 Tax=Agromyces archimandritae TaxID=2781962 RepID=A0A975FK58_9MICO|nr:hypothetical protein [Agromyces archimandritae]QTX03356.1 hypothetical protein G127AT_08155 [Agromyces archimandritae]
MSRRWMPGRAHPAGAAGSGAALAAGAALVAGALLALAACAAPPGAVPPGSGPDAPPWNMRPAGVDPASIDCAAEFALAQGVVPPAEEPPSTEGQEAPAPTRVGDDAEAVAVLRCSQQTGEAADTGRTTFAVVLERLEGDLDTVLAELARPDGPPPGPTTACMAMMEIRPPLWLVQEDGTAVRVEIPRDTCGFSYAELWDAVDALDVVERTETVQEPALTDDPPLAIAPFDPSDIEVLCVLPDGMLPGDELPAMTFQPVEPDVWTGTLPEQGSAASPDVPAHAPTAAPDDPGDLVCPTMEPHPAPPAD